jgi:threonine/homoserine/homoserine lactone efflux protein
MLMRQLAVQIDFVKTGLFWLEASILLGSPGPGIAALVAVGKSRGFAGGMRFFWGLQLGLSVANAACGFGLFSVVRTLPAAKVALAVVGTLYLIRLAYRIATAPVGSDSRGRPDDLASTASGGFLLGVTNPKAYVAFVSLIASCVIVRTGVFADVAFKCLSFLVIIVVVDLAWLWIGAIVGQSDLRPRAERLINVVMGSTVLITALLAWK